MHEILEETNNIQNLIYMGECYLFGRNGIEKDEEKAVAFFKEAASRNCGPGVIQAKVSTIKKKEIKIIFIHEIESNNTKKKKKKKKKKKIK